VTERIDPGGGGLTGATGDLTPDGSDEPFVPAERREQAGERAQGNVTYHQAAAAPAQQGEIGAPGTNQSDGPTNLAERESGYGSQHGLSPNDPAYAMEIDPPAAVADGADVPPQPPEGGVPRVGGDHVTDHEERF
jgi:hypothetical protein